MTEQTFVNLLRSRSTITTTLPGGIYGMQALGRRGLVRDNPVCAAAWVEVDGLWRLQTCVVVKEAITQPLYQRSDVVSQETGMLSTIELWFYSWSGHPAIRTAARAIYNYVQLQSFSGLGQVRHVSDRMGLYDPVNMDTPMSVVTYSCRFVRRVS